MDIGGAVCTRGGEGGSLGMFSGDMIEADDGVAGVKGVTRVTEVTGIAAVGPSGSGGTTVSSTVLSAKYR